MPESKRRKTQKPRRPPASRQTATAMIKEKGPSPTWYVAVMIGLMVIGLLLVIARFVFQLPQYWLFVGLIAIGGGFIMTTNYR
ncbi:MAG TPA: cell division protein CrgA [Acidimicrobiia bacterium]|nr:cell division protein CrgA [Acidimicrobiia bacterium]